MPDNVDRLKQLLFDSETRTLSDIAQRLDALALDADVRHGELGQALAGLEGHHDRTRAELLGRIEAIFERVGDGERLESSVAAILDGALRKAEADKHALVSEAVAPFVVNTVKTEIRNSKDELVEALYPVTGRIVKAYVASAMKDLADQINRRLEMNPIMLRLRSFATGRPVAELAIADTQRLAVEDLYLIRRGTGQLVARWPESHAGSNRDEVMSGVLTAINEFTTEAFRSAETALRHVDLGSGRVYLRVSPSYLLAAHCAGSAPVAVERVIDDGFLSTIERIGSHAASGEMQHGASRELKRLAEDLDQRIAEAHEEVAGQHLGASPLKLLAWIIAIPLMTWFAWSTFADYRVSSTRATVVALLEDSPEIKGYPTRVFVGRLGRDVTISGLAPTELARANVLKRVANALPNVTLTNELSVVPNALSDVEPQIEQLREEAAALPPKIEGVSGAVDDLKSRYEQDIARLPADVDRLRAAIEASEAAQKRDLWLRDSDRAVQWLKRASLNVAALASDQDPEFSRVAGTVTDELQRAIQDLERQRGKLADGGEASIGDIDDSLSGIHERIVSLSRALQALPGPALTSASAAFQAERTLDHVLAEAENLDRVAMAATQFLAVKRALPPPVTLPAAMPEQSPRDRLEAWTRANAIFFANGTDYRDDGMADRQFGEVIGMIEQDPSLVLRIIGYTDNLGTQDRNSPLAQARADRVYSDLVARGAQRDQLIALGRSVQRDISSDAGPQSANRRVEFEVGFIGETSR